MSCKEKQQEHKNKRTIMSEALIKKISDALAGKGNGDGVYILVYKIDAGKDTVVLFEVGNPPIWPSEPIYKVVFRKKGEHFEIDYAYKLPTAKRRAELAQIVKKVVARRPNAFP